MHHSEKLFKLSTLALCLAALLQAVNPAEEVQQVELKQVNVVGKNRSLRTDTLRQTVSYPYSACQDDHLIQTVLEQVGLNSPTGRLHTLINNLDTPYEWHGILSGGEQQRLSLAHALLHKPQILFLDEATNQLDDESALMLMQTLKHHLPDTLVIGISHQPKIQALFDSSLNLNEKLFKR